ncbi:hypothetical protein R6Z07F_008351 [Ovis aries]
MTSKWKSLEIEHGPQSSLTRSKSPSSSVLCPCPHPAHAFEVSFNHQSYLVEGLVLININPNGKGWICWAATKVSVV